MFTNNSKEFDEACQDLQWNHDMSTPSPLGNDRCDRKNCLHRSGGHSDQKNGRIARQNALLCTIIARTDGRCQDSVREKHLAEI